jgi:5-oxoprolinase (ATP-hydrolysing)
LSAAALWRVAVDTGGTFTDCIAWRRAADRAGAEVRRAKVLSTSALRCRVRDRSGDRVASTASWLAPDGFLAGARWSLLGEGPARPGGRVLESRADGELRLDAPAPEVGADLELRFEFEAPLLALRLALGIPPGSPLPPLELRLATTRGTNALLERRGARVALFVTAGFADLLAIGDQRRPDLFARAVRKPDPLYEWVVEVDERLAADGSVVAPLDQQALERAAREVAVQGAQAAAVAFLHSYRNADHERRAAATVRAAGLSAVVSSAQLVPLQRVVPRAETAVVEAYLAPAMGEYLERVAAGLGAGSTLRIMTSAGGLMAPAGFGATDGLVSGPAAGVLGVAAAARRAGLDKVLGFDMGGTSTDAARWNGAAPYRFESRVGDAVVLRPSLQIETVAAGGGSICGFDGDRLTVGPQSAGAAPGPACYGAGGPLTLTDVNLLLGRLVPECFALPLLPAAAHAALAAIAERLPATVAPNSILEGFLAIADERMAGAIREVSVRDGFDPAEFTLLSFGGAGGQHACAVAELLGIERVLVPRDTSLLSARGLAAARSERVAEAQVLAPLAEIAAALPRRWRALADEAAARLARDQDGEGWEVTRRIAALRLRGQETTLAIEALREDQDLDPAFRAAYRGLYGYEPPERPIEVESLRVVVTAAAGGEDDALDQGPADRPRQPLAAAAAWTGSARALIPRRWREELAPGRRLAGPALVVERWSVVWVAPGWRAEATDAGDLLLVRPPH